MANKPKFDYINVSDLVLDSCNPRIPKSLHNLSEKEIIDYLLLEAATLELMQAIGENDFFQGEQLLVSPMGGDKFKVVEGNRRLASVKLLNDPSLASAKSASVKQICADAKFHPTRVPCLIFDTEEEIRKYLGFRHITGIKPWGLSEKARYLNQMYHDLFQSKNLDSSSRELAKMIGSRREYVKRVLVAFDLYKIVEDEGFYKIRDLDDTTFYVGYLSDSLSKANIVAFLGINLSSDNPLENLNRGHFEELIHWFFEKNDQNKTRVKGKSDDLNKLNSVLGKESAYMAFSKGLDLERANELTEDLDNIFYNTIQNSLQYLEQADSIIHKITIFYQGLEEDLLQIRKLTTKIKQTKDEFKNGEFGD
jgi:hypothetical protein